MAAVKSLSLLSFVLVSSLGLTVARAQAPGPAQDSSSTPAAIELQSPNPVPDTKIYAFLRQEIEPDSSSVPVVKTDGGTLVKISVYAQTTPGKPGVTSFVFGLPRREKEIGAEATCRCIDSPVVSTEAYDFRASLALDRPVVSLYVKSDGKRFGPYAVNPLEVMYLRPVGAYQLQSELRRN